MSSLNTPSTPRQMQAFWNQGLVESHKISVSGSEDITGIKLPALHGANHGSISHLVTYQSLIIPNPSPNLKVYSSLHFPDMSTHLEEEQHISAL